MSTSSPEIAYPHEGLAELVELLTEKYSGVFARETVERYVLESYASLMRTAKIKRYLVNLTKTFASDRLRALAQANHAIAKEVPEVLFVCVQNAGRSQMAMGYLSALGEGRVGVRSAGSMPASELSQLTVAVMKEEGIDLGQEFPKPLTDDVVRAADVVITMGCGDACPIYPGKRYLDWELADPAEMDIDGVREVRDQIKVLVEGLLLELTG